MANIIPIPTNYRFQDITGRKFGRYIVISYQGKNLHNQSLWACVCTCGSKKIVTGFKLKNGGLKSCGCYKKEMAGRQRITHGLTNCSEHISWMKLKERCLNPKSPAFKNYGGRGIKVCSRWLHSFSNFFEDMGKKPTSRHSIDRINNDGDYEPLNCKWSTSKEQANNRRSHEVRWNGKQIALLNLCRENNIKQSIVHKRLQRGWSLEDAILKPPM